MISVIVPIYNEEPYLRKCLNSICNQTFRELDIILIDDGSTDRSGEICDEYVSKDARIRCLHTMNGGISMARNRGIEAAAEYNNPYIAFVDSDDWLEPDMYQRLFHLAQENSSDIAECGVIREYDGRQALQRSEDKTYKKNGNYNVDALEALLSGHLREAVWNKIWRSECFREIQFPVGKNCEDMAVTHLILENAEVVSCTSRCGYHYRMREGSIDHTPSMKTLTDLWKSNRDKFFYIRDTITPTVGAEKGQKLISLQLKNCANAILRNWAWRYKLSAGGDRQTETVQEMRDFSRKNIAPERKRFWPVRLRLFVLLTYFNHPFSFFSAYYMNNIRRKFSPFKLFSE